MAGPAVVIPVPLQRRSERRQDERFVTAMPVSVDGREATTRDLSSNGLAFTSERPYEIGAQLEVVIEYILDGHHYPLRCEAEVVRVQPADGAFTIGARLLPRADVPDVAAGPGHGAGRPALRSVR